MNHNCNCGHSHHHCSEEHTHHHCDCNHTKGNVKNLSETETHFLSHLVQYKYLPVVQFVVKSTKQSEFESVALSPVFITDINDTMEQVKNFGAKLKALEEKGYIFLDFDIPLDGYGYNEYYNSKLFEYFKQTVEQTKDNQNFLGDVPEIETGSIAPTEKCIELLK